MTNADRAAALVLPSPYKVTSVVDGPDGVLFEVRNKNGTWHDFRVVGDVPEPVAKRTGKRLVAAVSDAWIAEPEPAPESEPVAARVVAPSPTPVHVAARRACEQVRGRWPVLRVQTMRVAERAHIGWTATIEVAHPNGGWGQVEIHLAHGHAWVASAEGVPANVRAEIAAAL